MLGIAPSFEVEVADVLLLTCRFVLFILLLPTFVVNCGHHWCHCGSCRLESWNEGNLLRICLPNSPSAGNRPVLGSGYIDVL